MTLFNSVKSSSLLFYSCWLAAKGVMQPLAIDPWWSWPSRKFYRGCEGTTAHEQFNIQPKQRNFRPESLGDTHRS
jgi:hypothetical protein